MGTAAYDNQSLEIVLMKRGPIMYMHRHHKAFNENSNYNAGDKIARLFSRSEFGEKMLRYFYFLCLANFTELSTFHRDFSETHST